MNQARTIFRGDIISKNHVIGGFIRGNKSEKRLVFHILQFFTFEGVHHFHFFILEDSLD